MKTSTVLLVSALLFTLVLLALYDGLLRKEYLSGRFRNPYRNFSSLEFRDFDQVAIESSGQINVRISQGPFGVLVNSQPLQEYIKVTRQGRVLHLKAVFKQDPGMDRVQYQVIISCPRLKSVHTDTRFEKNGKSLTDTTGGEFKLHTLISGFKQDSMSIVQDHASNLLLAGNHIAFLDLQSGRSPSSEPWLALGSGNEIRTASLQLFNKSRVDFGAAKIAHLKYALQDSSALIFGKSILHMSIPAIVAER